ncbi:MAG: farnesyl diphosphate synthase [Candidatus Hydrogenedentota bacterium]
MDAEAFLKERGAQVEAALEEYISTWTDAPEHLVEAIRYALFAGGKRLRPALVLEVAKVCGGNPDDAMPVACALEMIHTYSLVHDDLPAMDDDDLRRGKPTVHKVFDEATAILVGDALLTMAFDVAAKADDIGIIRMIAAYAGVGGMVGGQFLDLASEGQTLGIEAVSELHARKTGALIIGAIRSGAIIADASSEQKTALTVYGVVIGRAFQVADDILDVTGDEAALGKPVGSDEGKKKSTYVSVLGLDAAKKSIRDTVDHAIDALSVFGPEADNLRALAQYIVDRDH